LGTPLSFSQPSPWGNRCRKDRPSKPVSRVLYSDKTGAVAIYLALMLPSGSSDQPGDEAERPFVPLFGLAPDGVCPADWSPSRWWALTPPFHPCLALLEAVCFCGTFRRVTPPGCYPAPCPVELGLSSRL